MASLTIEIDAFCATCGKRLDNESDEHLEIEPCTECIKHAVDEALADEKSEADDRLSDERERLREQFEDERERLREQFEEERRKLQDEIAELQEELSQHKLQDSLVSQ